MSDDLLRKFAELNPVADPDRFITLDAPEPPADPVLRALLEHAYTDNGRPDPVRSADVRNPWPAHTRGATQGRSGDMQTTEVRPDQQQTAHPRPKTLAAVGAAAAAILAVIAGLVVLNDRGSAPVVSGNAVTNVNGWVAFPVGRDDVDHDIYLAGLGRPTLRVTGSDSDGLDELCPAFSPDGARLAYGQAEGTHDTGHADAALIVADVDADGSLTEAFRVEMETGAAPPCPTWSPAGDRIAAGVRNSGDLHTAGDIWIVSTDDGTASVLEDRYVPHDPFYSDMEWSPDGTELAVSDQGGISLYSVAHGSWRTLPDTQGAGTLTWSPDGTRIAYDFDYDSDDNDSPDELRVAEVDGTGNDLLASGYRAIHGIGPVWSPTGDRIVYQRVSPGSAENHDVVLITPDGSETVLPHLRLPGADEIWWPWRVTWSPDGSHLLYWAWAYPEPAGPERNALIAVPLDPTSAPVVLYEGPIAGRDYSYPLATQVWARHPQAPSN